MPLGTTAPRSIRFPSKEFLEVLDAVYDRQGTNSSARLIEHAMADIERDGTPEEKATAREHLAGRPARGPKPKNSTPAGTNPAEELRKWADLRNDGVITEEEFEAKKTQLLGL